mmetsp:Transcript_34966/g.99263  ORF Transcript_34966/g.99263 Transcript_34966/m.99263 type:complete len:201 (+) Transcript_34966:189-791(+)
MACRSPCRRRKIHLHHRPFLQIFRLCLFLSALRRNRRRHRIPCHWICRTCPYRSSSLFPWISHPPCRRQSRRNHHRSPCRRTFPCPESRPHLGSSSCLCLFGRPHTPRPSLRSWCRNPCPPICLCPCLCLWRLARHQSHYPPSVLGPSSCPCPSSRGPKAHRPNPTCRHRRPSRQTYLSSCPCPFGSTPRPPRPSPRNLL